MKNFLWICVFMSLLILQAHSDCVWYGECSDEYDDKKFNCAYNGTAKPLYDETALATLKKYCPDMYKGNGTELCCDSHQLYTVNKNMGIPEQVLRRCPSCFYNFLNTFCQMTCSPNQSDYLHVDSFINKTKGLSVKEVDYIVSQDFAYGMFNSCRNVQMPSANELALDILCGKKAEQCTPENWLEYMGSTSNGQSPFQINIYVSNTTWYPGPHNGTGYTPMNVSITPCNVKYREESACSCQDCQESCAPIPPIPPKPKPPTILGIDAYYVVMFIIYLVFALIFGCYTIYKNIVVRNALGVLDKHDEVKHVGQPGIYSVNGKGKKHRKKENKEKSQYVEAVNESEISCLEKIGERFERALRSGFEKWGLWCASHPVIILILGLAVAGGLCGGIAMFQVVTDPVKLWSAPDSVARTQKEYFDNHFGPFYRTEQIIVTRPHNKTWVTRPLPSPAIGFDYYTSIFGKDFLHELLDLQKTIQNITAEYEGKTVSLEDICFQPLAPDNANCTIQSVLEYWQEDHANIDKEVMDEWGFDVLANYLDHFKYCISAPATTHDTIGLNQSCLAVSGQPIFPWIIMGGFEGENYKNATAFVITFVVNNHVDDRKNGPAKAWEKEFINFMKSYHNPNMSISFSSERSIEDEIERESNSDVFTIVISYLIMFLYIAVTLGQYTDFCSFSQILVDSKFILGLGGVVIVLLSVGASIGIFSIIGTPATLIIIEVVPFLALAVGVDNIFILVQTFQRESRSPADSLEQQVANVLGKVGPSMLLSSLSESIAFFLGALTSMPAVRVFSLFAGMAVLIDFLLQITCFVGLMTLDARRQEANRYDFCCCVPNKQEKKKEKYEGLLFKFVRDYYAHWLLKEWVRPFVVLLFTGWLSFSIAVMHKVDVGLDQKLSMPDDSFVLDYFESISKNLHVGPPVYFVVEEGYDYTQMKGQDFMCGGDGCKQDSLVGQIFTASGRSSYSRIAQPVSSWLDDYFSWLNSGGHPQCCRENITSHTLCPSTVPDGAPDCRDCVVKEVNERPVPDDFKKYLPWFLEDIPGVQCAKGGHAAYGSAVNLLKNRTSVGATYFMTYHTILRTSADYIDALQQARRIADNITTSLDAVSNTKVFPYSIFYVFYEQYLTIVHDTIFNLCLCVAAIFVVSFLLLGFDFFSAIMIVVTVAMIVVDMFGIMYLWSISLNAVSLVNLVMSIGIAVEFCAHVTRAFAVSLEPTKVHRARDALAHMGSSVLSGITLTKLGGIVVLAFSKSQLFQVFYFRMYLGMVICGASHGLIFLPVMLSYIGPSVNKAKLHSSQVKDGYIHIGNDQSSLVRNEALSENPPDYGVVS